ncbi:MsnO8 family LLM class oxidoreductase [Amycolatopsis sp.]|uniref:MsnO8 family LLM class oxidoreductase n=1 Tax=Amycolatopsis sp. TaxID=37632 RepID=UPI00261B0E54|nr:MsnO8 family LLM class oxidoreductase [Amycolatopsis sp.]
MRLSVLDRSPARQGGDHATALRDTVRFAADVEALGYHRFWVSEHHSVPGISGSAPTVLAAAVASATSTIRVGTGGVMLPNHQPLVVAEQFGVLESLFPGRIDMGLGRSVGFTEGVRRALGHGKDAAAGFGEQVTELLGYFTGKQESFPGVHAIPAEGLRVPVFLLATGSGADQAAELGLPLVIAAVRGEQTMLDAIGRYRDSFRPSALSPSPYVVVSSAVAVADSSERAWRMLLSEAWSTTYSRTHGVFPPLLPPAAVLAQPMTDRERRLLDSSLAGQIYGTEAEVSDALRGLVERTCADEVLVTTSVHDPAERLDSYQRLARVADIGLTTKTVTG